MLISLALAYLIVLLVGLGKTRPSNLDALAGEAIVSVFASPVAMLVAVAVFVWLTRRGNLGDK